MTKPMKTVRKTVVLIVDDEDISVVENAMKWERASKTGSRRVINIERAPRGVYSAEAGDAYLINAELTCRGANRHDFSKFVDSYFPDVELYFITD